MPGSKIPKSSMPRGGCYVGPLEPRGPTRYLSSFFGGSGRTARTEESKEKSAILPTLLRARGRSSRESAWRKRICETGGRIGDPSHPEMLFDLPWSQDQRRRRVDHMGLRRCGSVVMVCAPWSNLRTRTDPDRPDRAPASPGRAPICRDSSQDVGHRATTQRDRIATEAELDQTIHRS